MYEVQAFGKLDANPGFKFPPGYKKFNNTSTKFSFKLQIGI